MLPRVWVERAGSKSALFGRARPGSVLVDMPIDTVYMSMDMPPCRATLRSLASCPTPRVTSHYPRRSPFSSIVRSFFIYTGTSPYNASFLFALLIPAGLFLSYNEPFRSLSQLVLVTG